MNKILSNNADVLLIVPPFSQIGFQSLAAHTLQAVARDKGFTVKIFYANMHFASQLGSDYEQLCEMNYFLIGERLFARSAWGEEVSKQDFSDIDNHSFLWKRKDSPSVNFPISEKLDELQFVDMEKNAYYWINTLSQKLQNIPYQFVGLTSSYEQTNASISILKKVKEKNPQIKTIIGGYNCEGDCSEGIASLDPESEIIDYIFSGESENSFLRLLEGFYDKKLPEVRIIKSEPYQTLDSIPELDFSDYFEQLAQFLPNYPIEKINLVYETSRGCWWGEKKQCLFCGISERICYREKSDWKIFNEIESMKKWGINKLHMADLIMPFKHKKGLLNKQAESGDTWKIYFEQKVPLKFNDVELLEKAGVHEIQPGVETLSGNLLKNISKGTDLKKNIDLLKYITSSNIKAYWNIIWGFPGESNEEYRKINKLIPLITHLHPPFSIFLLALVKFSSYFRNREKYKITEIEPIPSYYKAFPDWADIDKLALMFKSRYHAETLEDPVEIDKMFSLVEEWNKKWFSGMLRPRLQISELGDGSIILVDTRGLENTDIKTKLTINQISVLLDSEIFSGTEEQNWAMNKKAAIIENNELIPLVTIDYALRRRFKSD